ncbi:DUF6978 family protein [Tenacibaculum ovolyticum]|uniref:DUF6978 family protein n=1 Tax=Tenacibaculum ovolyticum TaxID=104270 RepID=UPI00040403A5|nr:hypothetical protein [Tenacibaculum ovolyticum]
MLTNEEVKYLLKLDKTLSDPTKVIDLKDKKNRLELISNQDNQHKFWVEITSNKKILLKTSVHHLETGSHIGLLRIDYRGGHHNPVDIKDTLPDYLKKYADKWFKTDEPHMHIYVEGYKPLSWAIPLTDTKFPIQDITESADISDLIINFAKEINLNSKLNIQLSID